MREVGDDYVLQSGDTLEFLSLHGIKGVGHFYRSKEEIMEAFNLTEARFQEWLDLGLPVFQHSDGTVVLTEDAFDRWYEMTSSCTDMLRGAAEIVDSPAGLNGMVVNRDKFAVEYRGKTCPLRNTKAFHLIERLYQARGNYVTYSQLITEVWEGYQVTHDTIHQTVKTLRKKLAEAGMSEIVILTEHGCYALRRP